MLTFYSNDDLSKMYYSDGKTMLSLSPVISREEYIKAALDIKNTGTKEYEEVGILNTLVRRKYTNITQYEGGILFRVDDEHIEIFQTSPGCNGLLCSEPFPNIDIYCIPSALDGKGVERTSDYCNGYRWKLNGVNHRESDLPSWITSSGYMEWRINGLLHRENNKPAIIYSNGTKVYYLNGIKYNPTDVSAIDASNNANTNVISSVSTDVPVDTPVDAPVDESVNASIIAAKSRGCQAVIKLLSAMMNPFHKGELGWIKDILIELGITLTDVFEFIIADKDKSADEDTRYLHIAKEIFKKRLNDCDGFAINIDEAVSGLSSEVVLKMYEPFLLKYKLSREPVAGKLLYEYCYILSNYPHGDYDFNPFLLRFMKEAREETKIKATQILITHAK